jgi:purine-binding chemotaxis protein CheW
LAGKGFTPEVESSYRSKHPEMNFAQVDQIEGFKVDPASLQTFIKGLINLRGIIVPVFDPRERFYLPNAIYTPFHVIVVLEVQGRVMGILVDEILDVLEIDAQSVQDVNNLPPGLQTQYLKGIAHKDLDMILLLDMDRLLSPEELEALDAT